MQMMSIHEKYMALKHSWVIQALKIFPAGGRARSLPNDFDNGVTKIKILYAFFQLILSIK